MRLTASGTRHSKIYWSTIPRILRFSTFNFKAGQELPVHSHDIEGEVSLAVLEGEGDFLGKEGATVPAKAGAS